MTFNVLILEKMSFMKIISLVVLLLALLAIFSSCVVKSNNILDYVEDETFKRLLIDKVFAGKTYVTREDAAEIKKLNLNAEFRNENGIKSLKGIEFFINLTHLDCYNNQLTNLDLSTLTKLVELSCGSNKLISLDLSNQRMLTNLYCYDNQLSNLD